MQTPRFEDSPEYRKAQAALKRLEVRFMEQAKADFNERLLRERAKAYAERERKALKKFRAESRVSRPSFLNWLLGL